MSIDLDAVGRSFPPDLRSWDSKDALLYALGVGAGATDSTSELAFTTENSIGVEQKVLPTFGVIIGGSTLGGEGLLGLGDFTRQQILHGEQKITVHGPIPVSGTASSSGRIAAIYDKGRHANIHIVAETTDSSTGRLLVETETVVVVRGEGGFGGEPGPSVDWAVPPGAPDRVVNYETRPDQALLYRLSGDRTPLHSDPSFAAAAGFDRPILHGLCTYGFAGRALLSALLDDEPSRFGTMSARFASVVYPGDPLEVRIWETADGAHFQAWRADDLVLDRGVFERA